MIYVRSRIRVSSYDSHPGSPRMHACVCVWSHVTLNHVCVCADFCMHICTHISIHMSSMVVPTSAPPQCLPQTWGFAADFPLTDSRILKKKCFKYRVFYEPYGLTIINMTMCHAKKKKQHKKIASIFILAGSLYGCKWMLIPKKCGIIGIDPSRIVLTPVQCCVKILYPI